VPQSPLPGPSTTARPQPLDAAVSSSAQARKRARVLFAGRPEGRWRRFVRRLPAVFAVAAGGVVGGCARYGLDLLVPTRASGFPWPTFAANLAGAFCLALLLVLVLEVWPPTRFVRPFLAVGVLGSFTTFSTWMVEFDQLLVDGGLLVASVYVAASVLAGLAAASLGLVIGRGVTAHLTTRRSTKGR
jgi:fluoride exporter